MKSSVSLVFKPLRAAKMPVVTYMLSLITSSLMFPSAQILLGLTQKNLVNAIEFHDPSRMYSVYIGSMAIILLVSFINPIAGFCQSRSVHRFMQNFRKHTLEKLISLPLPFFDQMHSGDIMTRVDSDLEAIGGIYEWHLNWFLLGIFYGLGSVVFMLFLSWQLACVIIALAVAETWTIAKASLRIREYSNTIQDKISSGNALFLDIVKNVRLIRMFSLSSLLYQKYVDVNNGISAFSIQRNKQILLMNAVSDLFNACNLIGVLVIGIVMYFMNMVDLGSVMAFLIFQDGVSYMFTNLGEFFPNIQQSMASITRLYEILDARSEENTNHAFTEKHLQGGITCENLFFKYPSQSANALNGLTCEICDHKVTTITGASGNGKSTLAKSLLALYPVKKGSIAIGMTRYEELTLGQIRNHFAYVPQFVYLIHDTIEANIRCGNEKTAFDDVIRAAKAAKAHDFIMEKPDTYQTIIQEHGSNLSGGQRQRIAIARAILKNASVIILDEATSAIDSQNEAYIHAYVKQQTASGKTILMVAHRQTAWQWADFQVLIPPQAAEQA